MDVALRAGLSAELKPRQAGLPPSGLPSLTWRANSERNCERRAPQFPLHGFLQTPQVLHGSQPHKEDKGAAANLSPKGTRSVLS